MRDHLLGFCSSPVERSQVTLSASNPLPQWLQGILLRTGPALFELGPDNLSHWFDGLAKLQRVSFSPDGIRYSSSLLQSTALQGFQRTGRLTSLEFATRPRRKLLPRLVEILLGPQLTDNGNVNVLPMADGTWLTLTETTRPIQIKDDLSSSRPFHYQDKISGQLTTAHPVRDPKTHETINLVIKLGAKSEYLFTGWDRKSTRRRLIARLPVTRPSYQHSFAVTEHYIVLLESPLRVSPLDLRFSPNAFIDSYQWRKDQSSLAWIIDRDSGKVVRRHEIETCFHFHIVNAWEEGTNLCIDLPLYNDAEIIQGLRLKALRAKRPLPPSRLCRLTLPLGASSARREALGHAVVELPRLHPGWIGKRHRTAFLAASQNGVFLDSIVRW
jgi:carotenoid cleavage dioxygenase-like enzyme